MSDNVSKTVENSAADLKSLGEAAQQVTARAGQAGADALQQAKAVAGDAKDRAASLLGAAGEKASSVAEEQKQNVASYLDDVAKAVHKSGEQLEGHQDWIAHMVERGADELSTLAGTLRTNDLQSLLGDLGSLARRQPALFVGASMAAGFALARVGRIAAAGSTSTSTATAGSSQVGAGPIAAGPSGANTTRAGMTGSSTTGAAYGTAETSDGVLSGVSPASMSKTGEVGEPALPYAMGYPGRQP